MLTCLDVSRLISARRDGPLPLGGHVGLVFHLAMCGGCRAFARFVARAGASSTTEDSPAPLPPEVAVRLEAAVELALRGEPR